jgi:hydrogenase small subunit
MPNETVPYGRKTQKASPVAEVHILWITAGLGCDGDSVSITAATQPGIEDVVLGAIPGLPKVHLHNPVLAYENGDDFLKYWHLAEQGKLEPFVLVVEGSIPNAKIKKLLGGPRDRSAHRPAHHHHGMDRSPCAESSGDRLRGHLRHLRGIHAMEGNPTGCMGLADYLGWDWRSKAGLPIVNVPGCPVQPDNFMETCSICCTKWLGWLR